MCNEPRRAPTSFRTVCWPVLVSSFSPTYVTRYISTLQFLAQPLHLYRDRFRVRRFVGETSGHGKHVEDFFASTRCAFGRPAVRKLVGSRGDRAKSAVPQGAKQGNDVHIACQTADFRGPTEGGFCARPSLHIFAGILRSCLTICGDGICLTSLQLLTLQSVSRQGSSNNFLRLRAGHWCDRMTVYELVGSLGDFGDSATSQGGDVTCASHI
jgi:hypothetical protein